MRQLSPAALVLAQLTAFSLAAPFSNSATLSRSLSCTNAPTIQAGTLFNRRDLFPKAIDSRVQPDIVVICVPGTQVYVALTVGISIGGATVRNLLQNAAFEVLNVILQQASRNTLLHNGMFNFEGANSASVQVWNANNHQLTYGVLADALSALNNWMGNHAYTLASFGIFDSVNQVGNGVINGHS